MDTSLVLSTSKPSPKLRASWIPFALALSLLPAVLVSKSVAPTHPWRSCSMESWLSQEGTPPKRVHAACTHPYLAKPRSQELDDAREAGVCRDAGDGTLKD
ncbi:hypothetical protein C8R45DRAFT_180743 [Mycena sanguinolenta]|nr:hypothetical protein C8R45DRAFT_180743 [Mycena sanguinolenta]